MVYSRNSKLDRKNKEEEEQRKKDAGCGFFILIILPLLIFGPWSKSRNKELKKYEELTKAQNLQIETLKKTQTAFEDFITMLEKEKLDAELKAKKIFDEVDRLRGIQSIDQKTVDSIFYEQQQQNKRSKYFEWIAAWAIGVLSSVFFDLVLKNPLRRLISWRKTETQ